MAAATKTAAQFNTLVDKIVYNPKTTEGRGFLPPLLRTFVHLAYGLGIADDALPKDAADKKNAEILKMVKEEITGALSHCDKVEISDNFSTVAQEQLKTFLKAIKALDSEFDGWDRDTKIKNLQTLHNKGFGISAMLDRELIGLRNSDAGSSL